MSKMFLGLFVALFGSAAGLSKVPSHKSCVKWCLGLEDTPEFAISQDNCERRCSSTVTLAKKHKKHKKHAKAASMKPKSLVNNHVVLNSPGTAVNNNRVLKRAPPHSVLSSTQQCQVECVGNKERITPEDIESCKATCASTMPVTLFNKDDMTNKPKLSSKEKCVKRCMGMAGKGTAAFTINQDECESRCSSTFTLASKHKKHKKHMNPRALVNKNGPSGLEESTLGLWPTRNTRNTRKVAGMDPRAVANKNLEPNRAPPHAILSSTKQCEVECLGNKEIITQADIDECKDSCSTTEPMSLSEQGDGM